MEPLLTSKKVAELLNLSVRTIYGHRNRLDGFYPAGINDLRFRRDMIEAIVEGRTFTIIRPDRSKKGFKTDSTKDSNRHGL